MTENDKLMTFTVYLKRSEWLELIEDERVWSDHDRFRTESDPKKYPEPRHSTTISIVVRNRIRKWRRRKGKKPEKESSVVFMGDL